MDPETFSCTRSSIHLQTSLVRSKFVEALQNYQQVEQQYRTRYRQRVERQFKIGESWCLSWFFTSHSPSLVKPDATPEEVNAVVQSDEGAGGQVFAQAVRAASFHLGCLLSELCSSRLPRVMESPAPHIGKSRNDMKTSERSNVRSPSWHKCSMRYEPHPDLPSQILDLFFA